ncbi:MAG: ComF family protein [Candidatus Omnitrophica bacterium]|nr:ComF family protein [Candidatus Omnitrophota bacterium]
MFKDLVQGLGHLVYPPHCLVCSTHYTAHPPGSGVCPPCRAAIVFNRPPFCRKCSRHLGISATNICKECRKAGPSFDFAWSACLYEDPIKDLLHRFKYGQKTQLRRLFAEVMISFIKEYGLDTGQFDAIVPIPLSSTRSRERGYNQAQLLAQELAREFSIPLAPEGNHLRRVRHTGPQSFLDEKQRWTNIKGAFTIRKLNNLKHKNILLIDDLLTTGATASEAARVLKDAGAGTVGVLTLAITAERT